MNTASTRPTTAKGFTEPRNLPKYLQEHGLFCVWRYEQRDDKWTKVPYQPRNYRYGADSTNPKNFTDIGTALAVSGAGFDGLGIGIFDDLAAIDIDHCIDEAGNLSMMAQSIIELMDSYTEYSPSGKGIRIIFRAPGLVYDRNAYYINKRDASDPREQWPQKQGLEVYIAGMTNKYVTVTGDTLRAVDVAERTQQALQVVKRYMAKPPKPATTKAPAQPVGASLDLSDRELLDKARNADNGDKFKALFDAGDIHEYDNDDSKADQALCCILAYWTGRDADKIDRLFRESALMRDKWNRNAYRTSTIEKAISKCDRVYSPRTFDAPPPPEPPAYMVQQTKAQGKPEQKNTQGRDAARPVVKSELRNHPAFRIAANLRAQGVPEAKIHEQIVSYGKNDCVPPMTDEQIEAVYNLILSFPPKTKLAQMLPGKERFTPEKLAEELEARGYAVRMNLISREYEVKGRTETGRAMSLDDLTTILHGALVDAYKGVTFATLEAYVTLIGRNNEYNPVLDVLRAAVWDGRDRIPQLFELIGIEKDDKLSQVLVRKWLKQSVAMLFNTMNDPNPNIEPYGAEGVLVFNGEQGAGKTSLFRHLAMKNAWFGEGMAVDDRDKDTKRRIVTVWLAELGEVETTLKSDINALKNFVTASVDQYRLPYGRADVNAPRMTSMCATCNSDRYLIDTTGNRRWWSIPFNRVIPYEEIEALDALQLWAQVFAEVAPMEYNDRAACFRLTDEEKAELAKRNGDYEKPVKGQTEVEDILARAEAEDLPTKTMTASDWKEYWPVLRPYTASQLGVALKKCGIITKEYKRDGRKGRWAELPIPKTY